MIFRVFFSGGVPPWLNIVICRVERLLSRITSNEPSERRVAELGVANTRLWLQNILVLALFFFIRTQQADPIFLLFLTTTPCTKQTNTHTRTAFDLWCHSAPFHLSLTVNRSLLGCIDLSLCLSVSFCQPLIFFLNTSMSSPSPLLVSLSNCHLLPRPLPVVPHNGFHASLPLYLFFLSSLCSQMSGGC